MNITRLSINRPVIVTVFYLFVILLGAYSYTRLNYELVPKFTPEVITVATVYPGATPDEVETNVSQLIEDALSSVEKVDVMTSNSQENFSLVRLEMIPGTDVDLSLQEVQRKIASIAETLPTSAKNPVITRFDFNDLPVMRIGVSSSLNNFDFFDLAHNQIVPAISRLEGVAEVRLLGGQEKEVKVDVYKNKLDRYGISMLQIVQALQLSNKDVPVGSISDNTTVKTFKLSGRFSSLEQIRKMVILHPRTKTRILLQDVAEVYEDAKKQQIVNRVNLNNSLGIDIKKQGDANAVEMSSKVKNELARLEERYAGSNLTFNISQDTSEFTLEAADAVLKDLGYAVLFVSLVMVLFLHSLRNAFIVLLSIPISIISTYIVMFLLGYSLNLLSLLGLSLAIGILVDDSIVVIENIYRHLEMGKHKRVAAYDGRVEIGFTAVSITAIDVVVFLPIIFSSGLVADLLRQFSVVILVSTSMSLLVSFTLVPLLASRIGKLQKITNEGLSGRFILWFESQIDAFGKFMTNALTWANRHRAATLIIATAMFLSSIALIPAGLVGIEFIKGGDRGEFLMELELPKGTSLQKTNEISAFVEAYISNVPEVNGIFSTVGITSAGRIEFNSEYLSELSVKLIDKRDRERSSSQIARQIKLDLESSIPGLKVRPIDINLLGLRDDDAVQVTVLSNNQENLYRISNQVEDTLKVIRGTVEVNSSISARGRELQLIPDRNRMELLKVNPTMAGATLRTAVNGNQDSKYLQGDSEYDINIQLASLDKQDPNDLLELSVMNEIGQLVKMNQLMEVKNVESPGMLQRTNRTPSVTLKSQVIGRTIGTVNREFRNAIEGIDLPEGVEFLFGGQSKRTTDGLRTMAFAFAASILLVYFVLVILYNSFIYPLVVLLSIPLAMIGALLSLSLTMEALSIFSILGMVMLVGLVGKNAILVVDFTNRLRSEGTPLEEALVKATKLRFRPILMTNISMIVGLLPIALAAGAGSEWKNGLAWAIIGGLSSSMLLTLIVVPVVYSIFARSLKDVTIKG